MQRNNYQYPAKLCHASAAILMKMVTTEEKMQNSKQA